MFRKLSIRRLTIALAATLAIGAAMTATEASAHGHGGFGRLGGIDDFGFHPADQDCYQIRRVPTARGWRLRRVWVCG